MTWWITHIKRGASGGIEKYHAYDASGDSLADGHWFSKYDVAARIIAGEQFFTATKKSDGSWHRAAVVDFHLSTDADKFKSNNLENLPAVK